MMLMGLHGGTVSVPSQWSVVSIAGQLSRLQPSSPDLLQPAWRRGTPGDPGDLELELEILAVVNFTALQ